ncbi:retinol dehydrogenase 13 isoform X2 [Cephus cinctus]|uniref:Retinol dehydrogenase 13 isoform X2 n=2 Tax=Cephus cinctus TaxID=211228 RepID=A0AAJ7VYI1_CEPCN|nr:retinol dehydrogenase 13 isoform X2 [Cephus cinctus]
MGIKTGKLALLVSAAGTVVGGVYLIKAYVGGTLYEGTQKLTDKVVIITGANTGIGKETALNFAKREAKVIMACRDMHKCEKTRRQIVLETKNRYVYCRKCDLASYASIRTFVDQFKKEQSKLDILVNNAGVMRCPQCYTEDGIEMQLGVNHMGHFLLTNLLLDTLKASAPSRIINVSSIAHTRGKIKVTDLNSIESYDPGEAYAQSKLANVLFTRELAKRLEGLRILYILIMCYIASTIHLLGTGVTVNAVHPGIVDTEITRYMSFYNSILSAIFVRPLVWPFIKSPLQGAQTIIYAAVEPQLKDVSGKYFSDCKETDVSEEAKDEKLAKWLWMTSEKWTKLNVRNE